jgi:hypothetical protein
MALEKTIICFSKLNKWHDVCFIHAGALFFIGRIQMIQICI